jgi:uncharacterized protein (TIRG00374 family)
LLEELALVPKISRKRYISYLLRFGVAAAALYLAFRKEDLTEVANVLLGINLWIFAASLGIYIISQLIFVMRWYVLLRVQSIEIGFWAAVRLHFLGLFYNNCLPTSVGGDLLRAWYVTSHTDKKLEAALSVFVDRVIGLTGMLIMASCCYWFIPVEGQTRGFELSFNLDLAQRINEHRGLVLVIAAVLAISILALASNRKGRALLRRCSRFIRQHGSVALSKGRNAIRIYYSKKLAVGLALVLTFFCQATFITGLWLIGREIGVDAHVKYYFIFFPISWLLGTLPISVGGLGIMEGWLKVAFSQVSTVSGERALVLGLCQRLIWLFGSLPGVAIHLIGAHLPKDFSIDYNKPVN